MPPSAISVFPASVIFPPPLAEFLRRREGVSIAILIMVAFLTTNVDGAGVTLADELGLFTPPNTRRHVVPFFVLGEVCAIRTERW
jgi:hypothetical protein